MGKEINTDVLITGAGSTGLTLASILKLHGIDFSIIDKSATRVFHLTQKVKRAS